MEAFDVVGDPVRRRILEALAITPQSSGEVVSIIREAFGISQAAVSQHLKVLRENGFATVRAEGTRRIYSVDPAGLIGIDRWLSQFRDHWEPRLDALATEVARGKHQRRRTDNVQSDSSSRSRNTPRRRAC